MNSIAGIFSMFEDLTILSVYGTMFFVGMIFILGSLIFGGDASDSDFNFDEADLDHSHDSGPSFFSIRSISIGTTGFGGVGYMVQHYTGNIIYSCGAGAISGFIMAFLSILLIRLLINQQASSGVTAEDIANATGLVSITIPKNGAGEVSLSLATSQISKMARSKDGSKIIAGTPVRVSSYSGSSVTVEKII